MNGKKLDLIAQLLAKAESTTPAEAEALTEHAERLMLKYAIDQATIDARRAATSAPEPIIEVRVRFDGVYAADALDMAVAVMFGLGTLTGLQSRGRSSAAIFLVGFESDVRQAELLIRSLHVQSAVAMRAWWKAARGRFIYYTEHEKQRARGDFIRGFGDGAASRIRANRRQIVEESGPGTALALVDRRRQAEAWKDKRYADLGAARARKAPAFGWSDGHVAGEQANTGERAVRPTEHAALTS